MPVNLGMWLITCTSSMAAHQLRAHPGGSAVEDAVCVLRAHQRMAAFRSPLLHSEGRTSKSLTLTFSRFWQPNDHTKHLFGPIRNYDSKKTPLRSFFQNMDTRILSLLTCNIQLASHKSRKENFAKHTNRKQVSQPFRQSRNRSYQEWYSRRLLLQARSSSTNNETTYSLEYLEYCWCFYALFLFSCEF